MRKIIRKNVYESLYNGIEDFINRNLRWNSNKALVMSFNSAFNRLFKDCDCQDLKQSCRQLILEKCDYEKAIKRIIIWKYTRESDLILEDGRGDMAFFEHGIKMNSIKEKGV